MVQDPLVLVNASPAGYQSQVIKGVCPLGSHLKGQDARWVHKLLLGRHH